MGRSGSPHADELRLRGRRMARTADYKISADTIRALVEARHDDPFAVLGPHEAAGGVVIRALVPGAAGWRWSRRPPVRWSASSTQRHEAGLFEGMLADRPAWFGYTLRAHNDGGHLGCPRPLPLPAGAGRPRRLPDPRGHPPAAVGAAGRARDRACGRGRRAFRGLGAERRPGLGDRRLQRLGRPAQPDARAAPGSGSGRSSSRRSARACSTSTSCAAPTARCCR